MDLIIYPIVSFLWTLDHGLVLHVFRSTGGGLNQGPYSIDLVLINGTGDVTCLCILPSLSNSDYAVLSLSFRDYDSI